MGRHFQWSQPSQRRQISPLAKMKALWFQKIHLFGCFRCLFLFKFKKQGLFCHFPCLLAF
jgi:hypothetical protein